MSPKGEVNRVDIIYFSVKHDVICMMIVHIIYTLHTTSHMFSMGKAF